MPIDVDQYLQHTRGRSLVEVLLRGHLWVEQQLIRLLEAELQRPEALRMDRLPFSQKVNLADALGMLHPDDANTVRFLNTMRNRLAHDLSGQPTEVDVDRLENGMRGSQTELAAKLVAIFLKEDKRLRRKKPDPDAALCRRLYTAILALLTELEQHSQWHAYWRQHRSAMEGYQTMVTIMERLGATPETEEEYRKACGIPEPPTPRDAIKLKRSDVEE